MNKNLFTLMYYLFAILLIIACFLAIGYFTNSETMQTSIKIGASPQNCYTVYNDPNEMKAWTENFKALELVEGEYNRVGAKYKLILTDPNGGPESIIHEELIEAIPGKSQVVKYSNEYLEGTMTTTFEAVNDSTLLTSVNRFKGKSILLRSVFHFIKDKVSGDTGEQYLILKELIEKKYPSKQTIDKSNSVPTILDSSKTEVVLDTIQ